MKKTLSLLLVTIMLLSLASLAAADDVTIRGMHWNSSTVEHDRYQITFDKFKEETGITIDFEWFPTGFAEKLAALFADKNAPDFFATYVGDLGMRISRGLIQPVTDRYNAENFDLTDLLETAVITYKDDVYAILPVVQPQMLYYNKAMFDNAGVAYPTEDWTWQDLLDTAQLLTVKDGDKVTQYGFQCDEYSRVWMSKFWSDGGVAFDDESDPTKSTFNNEIGAKAAQFLVDLVQGYGVAPPPGVGAAAGTLGYREVFTNEGVAMILDGSWMTAQYAKNLEEKLGVSMVPLGEVKRGGWLAPTGMFMSSTTKHPDEVWAFQKYLSGYENSIYFGGYGDSGRMAGVPVWRSAFNDERWKGSEMFDTIQRQAEVAKVEMMWQGYGSWYWDYLNVALQELVLEGGDPLAKLNELAARTDAEVLPEIER